jgi:fructokinase
MSAKPIIVGLGEVLLDVFPDGSRFGGAPANFACSAAGVGGHAVHVAMVSAVGNDKLGRQALRALADHAVDVRGVNQIDFQTGQVLVSLDKHGQATYEFASNTAWDHLE